MNDAKSLWGDLSSIERVRTPRDIMQEQADIFNKATKGVVRAEVDQAAIGSEIILELDLVAAEINNYRYTLTRVQHKVTLYPAEIYALGTEDYWEVENEADFTRTLGDILSSASTMQIVSALISQST